MKKLFILLIASLVCTVAFALPRPSQIEDALAGQHYAEARGMVNEVLRERPDSARAHLLNAYLLARVDHNKVAANAELQSAVGLDKRGDVRSSPMFGRVVGEIDSLPTARATAPPAQRPAVAPASSTEGSGVDWLLILCALSIGTAVIYFIFRRRPGSLVGAPVRSAAGATFREAYPDPLSAHARPMPPQAPQSYYPSAAQSSSSGALGTVAAVAGGVMAGNAMSAMLMGSRSSNHYDSDDEQRRRRLRDEEDDERRRRDSMLTTYSDSSPVSTSSERSSFSSSSSGSDSWSSSDSFSSSSDSRSSSDFGSSSSSDW